MKTKTPRPNRRKRSTPARDRAIKLWLAEKRRHQELDQDYRAAMERAA